MFKISEAMRTAGLEALRYHYDHLSGGEDYDRDCIELIYEKMRALETVPVADGKCWRCSCGYVVHFTADDIVEYGEPSECGICYREDLEEIDMADGLARLADLALVTVREAQRDLVVAQTEFSRLDDLLSSAKETT